MAILVAKGAALLASLVALAAPGSRPVGCSMRFHGVVSRNASGDWVADVRPVPRSLNSGASGHASNLAELQQGQRLPPDYGDLNPWSSYNISFNSLLCDNVPCHKTTIRVKVCNVDPAADSSGANTAAPSAALTTAAPSVPATDLTAANTTFPTASPSASLTTAAPTAVLTTTAVTTAPTIGPSAAVTTAATTAALTPAATTAGPSAAVTTAATTAGANTAAPTAGDTNAATSRPLSSDIPLPYDSLNRSLPRDERGRLLIQAAKKGSTEEVRALLAAGVDVGAEDRDRPGFTALHWAAARGHVEVARYLLQAGAELQARTTEWQQTPLHYAASGGHTAVVRLLLDSSADVNARNKNGATPLHGAAEWGRTQAAAALLEAGADRAAKDNAGQTALDWAREKNHQTLIEILQ